MGASPDSRLTDADFFEVAEWAKEKDLTLFVRARKEKLFEIDWEACSFSSGSARSAPRNEKKIDENLLIPMENFSCESLNLWLPAAILFEPADKTSK